jgi:A/G-specific adenine glycosylase
LSERNEKKLWEYAYTLFDPTHPFEYNQAMMDIGATICLPKKPLCTLCSFEPTCKGKESPLAYPEAKIKGIKPIRKRSITLYRRAERYALKERTSRFLNGLWGFFESEERATVGMHYLGHITQHYSHFTLDAEAYLSDNTLNDEEFEWFELHEISALSLSRADHKAVELLRYNLKKEDD